MSLGAKNPRDQVYALLSLASDSTVPELQPNYSLAISNKEIFTKISWHYLQDGNHLSLFLSAGLASRLSTTQHWERTPGLPSWAFDFAIGPRSEFRLGNWAVAAERKRAVRLVCHLAPEMERLSVHSTIIDRVAFVASQPAFPVPGGDGNTTFNDINHYMLSTMDTISAFIQEHLPEHYPGGITREEAYWRTMLMDCFMDHVPASPVAKDILATVREGLPQLLSPTPAPSNKAAPMHGMSPEHVQDAGNSLMDSVVRIWAPYTFVILQSGYMGWAPHGVRSNDVFCLFDRCIVPFVLRPTGTGNVFNLWGDGYVHGFLPGQRPGIQENPKQWVELV